jgi:hypothetical protein
LRKRITDATEIVGGGRRRGKFRGDVEGYGLITEDHEERFPAFLVVRTDIDG